MLDLTSPELKKNAEVAQRLEHTKILMRKLARTNTIADEPREELLQVDLLHN